MTERISNAIDVLLAAVNNRTLAKGTCVACAVGNLVAAGLDAIIYYESKTDMYCCSKNNSKWRYLFMTNHYGVQNIFEDELNNKEIMQQINTTEFTWQELAKIENTFEKNTSIWVKDYYKHTDEEILQDQIKGLEAVVQVILDFDNCMDNVYEVFTSKVTV